MYSITGASENHNLIVANTIIALGIQLRKRPSKLYPSDMLLHIAAVNDYYYPDITIVCGEANIIHDKRDILLNPTLIIEVLSPSTEQHDRGNKFENYLTLDSLQEYLLIAQDRPHLEQYIRQEKGHWLFSAVNGLGAKLELPSISTTLALADVYDKVNLREEGVASQPPTA